MKQGFFRRACTLATAVAAAAGVLVVAAPTASASHTIACEGDVVFHVREVRVEIARADSGTRVCYTIGGVTTGAYVVRGATVLLGRDPTFQCVAQVPGSVGDPSEPATYHDFRVGLDAPLTGPARFCVEVDGAAVTLTFGGATPPVVQPGSPEWTWNRADDCASNFSEYVLISAGGVRQDATVPVHFLLYPDYDNPYFAHCTKANTTGFVVCEVFFHRTSVYWSPEVRDCGLSPEASRRVDELVAFVSTVPGLVLDTAGRVVQGVLAEVDRVRQHPLVRGLEQEAARVVGVVTTEADKAVATVRAEVDRAVALALEQLAEAQELVGEVVRQLPVQTGTDTAACPVSVLSVGGVAVRRSATGAVPASVCVVTGTTAVRVTVG